MNNKELKEIAKAVWEYKHEIEESEELERVRFNDCFDRIIKRRGYFKSLLIPGNTLRKEAHILYVNRYGELKDKGDIK